MAKRFYGAQVAALGAVILLLAGVTTAQAQGSRKDDIVFNAQGRPMAGASVRVCAFGASGQPCTPLASIYSDAALTQALANPTSTDGLGNYNFYAAPGRYMIEISGPGIITKQIPNVILPSDPSTPTFTSVTTTSGISAFSLSLSGNLTVSGSTAVTGALTVGGMPVPTANQDNQWTAGQRFKGPIPWRDLTAYMPAGGCSSTIAQVDPPTTGTISSGSATLTLANARDFKNGCGIAVLNAGATSTIPTPNQGCTVSSITRAANVVTVTCSAAHGMFVNAFDHFQPVQITGVTDSSFNGTFDLSSVADTTHFTYPQIGANGSSSGGSATMQWGYAHGVTGATSYNYKVSAVDGNGGMSAASPAITITNGNATLSTLNYNWITYPLSTMTASAVPHQWVIYSDKGLGGAYSCVGTSYASAYSDYGLPLPCPAFAPATPPVSATAQVLNTTISSGGGTTTLTLAVTASNTATTQNVYHDESSFLNSCIADDQNDRGIPGFPRSSGAYGCYVPAGNYFLNGPLASDTVSSTAGATIYISGSLYLNVFPWFFRQSSYYVRGTGNDVSAVSFGHSDGTNLQTSPSLAAAVVIQSGSQIEFSGFAIATSGHGIWVGQDFWGNAPNGYRFDNDQIATGAGGVPLWIENNVLGLWSNNSSFSSSTTSPASIMVTGSLWNSSMDCCIYLNDISTTFHGIRVDAPGGNGTGGGMNSIYVHNWINESLQGTEGMVIHDSGPNAIGTVGTTVPLNFISLHNLNNSDAIGGPSVHPLFEELGSSPIINNVDANEVASFGSLLGCGPGNPTVCTDRSSLTANVANGPIGGTWGGDFTVGSTSNNGVSAGFPLYLKESYSQAGGGFPAWAQVLPPPSSFQVTGTGAGSLAAATYCMAVEGKDAQTTPGLTLPSNTLCQAVSASGAINLQWAQGGSGSLNQAFSGFRFFFCSTGGSSCVPNTYLDLAGGGNPYNYSFTSTGGGTSSSLNTNSTAYLSWLYWDRGTKSCLLCTLPAGSTLWQLGIGEANPGAGVKLAVAGGTIQGEGGIQAGSDVAFNASPRNSYNAFLPNLTSGAATYQRMTLDKAITVTRLQLVLGTAGAGCTTQSTVSVTDGTTPITLTTVNGTVIYDSGAISQNYAAAANLDVKIATPASGCTTAPQNANVNVQYRMQ
jgi:hypothetical protein